MVEIHSSIQAFHLIKDHFNPVAEEVWALALNSQLKLIEKEMIFKGTVNACPLHPRDIFRFLILKNATAFIIVHNHPSNDCQPSEQDIKETKRLQKIGHLLEISLIDHLIIGENKYFSLADFGFIKTKFTARIFRSNGKDSSD